MSAGLGVVVISLAVSWGRGKLAFVSVYCIVLTTGVAVACWRTWSEEDLLVWNARKHHSDGVMQGTYSAISNYGGIKVRLDWRFRPTAVADWLKPGDPDPWVWSDRYPNRQRYPYCEAPEFDRRPPSVLRRFGIDAQIQRKAQIGPWRDCSEYSVTVPYWFMILALLGVPAYTSARGSRRWLRRWRGLCPVCGYDLRASKERCPECGSFVGGSIGAEVSGNASRE